MNGNVQGLPKQLPISEAIMLTRNNQAKNIPIIKCKPNKGVNAAETPNVKPNAILCGLPGNLFNLKEVYLIILFQPFLGHKILQILDKILDFCRVLNNIIYLAYYQVL